MQYDVGKCCNSAKDTQEQESDAPVLFKYAGTNRMIRISNRAVRQNIESASRQQCQPNRIR